MPSLRSLYAFRAIALDSAALEEELSATDPTKDEMGLLDNGANDGPDPSRQRHREYAPKSDTHDRLEDLSAAGSGA